MIEILAVVGVVLVGWWALQMLRSRPTTPSPPPAPVGPPLPDRLKANPTRFGSGTRVHVTHSLVRRAAERAFEHGRHFVVKDGGELYLVLDAIEDEDERRRAHDILTRAQDGVANVDIQELLYVTRLLTER